jgi:phospholipid/cholesterol/gamma-HCH transport system ATP-binding protein
MTTHPGSASTADPSERRASPGEQARPVQIRLQDIELRYGDTLIQQQLSFDIHRGDVFVIMGGSGCGKSTVMRCLTGLLEPRAGRVLIDGMSLWQVPRARRTQLMRRNGVMYQGGALWSSMTLEENVALPLEQYTRLDAAQIRAIAEYKLALVGLAGYGGYYPSEISGGMRKRVGVARAMALDPDTLFFDEPSAGLDPISARRMDELILQLRDSLGTTMVVISHDLDSIFTIGDDAVFLDAETKTMLTTGDPRHLRDHSTIGKVREFLNRGEERPR